MANLRSPRPDVKKNSPLDSFKSLYLLSQLIKRDFRTRFMGSALGIAWAVLQPLSLVLLYWFVFTVMIPRGPGAAGREYVLFLISGLLPWLGINEGIMRASTSVVENAAMVRRLPFRSDLLVVVPNASAALFELIAMALFLGFLVSQGASLRGLWVLPFALTMQFALQVGVGWLLSVLYVFFRDVTQILAFVLSFVFYLSPILYPVSPRYESFFNWNPLTPLLGLFRSALLDKPLPPIGSIVFLLAISTVVFGGGLVFFRRAQPGLVDLI